MGGIQPRRASGLRRPGRGAVAATLAALPLALGALPAGAAEQAAGPVYPTFGVHNPPSASPCASPDCDYQRSGGQPTDPDLPGPLDVALGHVPDLQALPRVPAPL